MSAGLGVAWAGARVAPVARIGEGGVSDVTAPVILRRQYEALHKATPDDRTVRAMQCVARLENYYGQAKPFGGSHNWGCIQCCKPKPDGTCPEGSFLHEDSYPTKDRGNVKYAICFRSYPDDDAGAAALIKQLTTSRKSVWALLSGGNVWAICEAMYRTHYYGGFGSTDEQRISGYYKAMVRADQAIGKATGTGPLLSPDKPVAAGGGTPGAGGGGGGGLLLVGVVAGTLLLLGSRGRR